MSTEVQGTAAPEPDRLANLQAEFTRKQENTNTELQAIKASLAEAVSRLPKPAQAPAEDDSNLLYENPTAYKQKLTATIEERVAGKVNEIIETRTRADNERISTLSQLVTEYPELQKADTGLYQETQKILAAMPANKRNTGEAYDYAVHKAASMEGIKPMSKRGTDSNRGVENFSFNGKKNEPPRKSADKSDVDPKTVEWMKLLDPKFDEDDDKQMDELKKYTKRDFRNPQ